MPNIAFIIPSIGTGGAERVVATLAQSLAKTYKCLIFVRPGSARHYNLTGVKVVEVDYSIGGFRHAIEKYKVDLVSTHFHWDAAHVRQMAMLADEGVPVILTEHNAFHYPMFQKIRDGLQGYDRWFEERYAYYRKFACVTVLNEDARAFFSQHLDNIKVVYNPAPFDEVGHADYASKTLLNVSHFRKRAKRLDYVYAAFKQVHDTIPDACLKVVGDYDWVIDTYYRQRTGLLGPEVNTPGRSRIVDLHYQQSAVFVMASEIEGQPMVLLEAAQHAMPQVCFDIPGLSDQIIDGVTGHLIPYGDTDAFAACCTDLLNDPATAKKMGLAARDFVRDTFPIDSIVDTWIEIFEDVLAGKTVKDQMPAISKNQQKKKESWDTYWSKTAKSYVSPLQPKISFLVPVHGTEEILGRCLSSIQLQTMDEFECIVVNDGSPGNVHEVFENAVKDDMRFRIVDHDGNRGLYQARSTAADLATGQYFANIDSDDYLHPKFAEIMYGEAMTSGAEIVECKAIELHTDGRPIEFNTIKHSGPVDGSAAARSFFNGSLRNVVWNKIYSRDLWMRTKRHNSIDEGLTICEDTLRNTFLFPECERYSSVKDCLYFYCRRPTSVVTGGDLKRLSKKLSDIEFVYKTSKELVADAGNRLAWEKLEKRRVEDYRWYAFETLSRYKEAELRDELWNLKDETDAFFQLVVNLNYRMMMVTNRADNRDRAWKWEKRRADELSERLQRIFGFMDNKGQ